LVNVDDHVLSPNDTCGGLHLQPGLDSPEPPETHLILVDRERDHETNLPDASDTQALSKSEGRYLRTAVVPWAVPMTCDVELTLTLARGSEVKQQFRRKKSSRRR
jgi:hypothetical protein